MNLPTVYEERLRDKKLVAQFSKGRYDDNMQVAAERQFALQILDRNPKLQKCTPESLAMALLDASYSGLSLSPPLAHAYLIPYKDQAQFSPGYRGLLHLAYRAGTIRSVQVNLVHENDPEFHVWTDETGRHIKHVESRAANRGQVTHAYCIAFPAQGGPPMIEVKKAVIRRASKYWPKDTGGAMQHMMEVSDKFDSIDFPETAEDTEAPEQELCISQDQISEIEGLLQDEGVPPTMTGQWLHRYAERLGYNQMEHVPARLYEQAKKELVERAREWAKK
jgi:phage RecT family recombinase